VINKTFGKELFWGGFRGEGGEGRRRQEHQHREGWWRKRWQDREGMRSALCVRRRG
jgi:hypothetical protein